MAMDCDVNKALPDLVVDIESDDEDTIRSSHHDDVFCAESSQKNVHDCQTAGPSTSGTALNGKISTSEEQKSSKAETRTTPRRSQFSNSRGNSKLKQSGGVQGNIRFCEQHTFLTDVTEVRQMEQGLLKLLDDFHCGKLQAFGKDCTFEKMEQVREQQERLARLHFELNAQQEIYGPQSEDGRSVGRENLGKLIENLQQLSRSIEQLQVSSPSVQTDV